MDKERQKRREKFARNAALSAFGRKQISLSEHFVDRLPSQKPKLSEEALAFEHAMEEWEAERNE